MNTVTNASFRGHSAAGRCSLYISQSMPTISGESCLMQVRANALSEESRLLGTTVAK